MNLNLSLVLGDLSENQRMALAAMIMDTPITKPTVVSTLKVDVTADTSKAMAAIDALAAHAAVSVPPEIENEIAYLAKEGGEFEASVAFGAGDQHDPAAAFGGTPAPLPPGAMPAPFIAVAVPPSTVPVATPTSINPANGPAMPAPLPAPVAVAPSAPVAPLTPASGVELDKNGLPWDARIHASTKTKKGDGTWTAKRGVDPALVPQVEAELRQVMGAPAAPLAQQATGGIAQLAATVAPSTPNAAFSNVPPTIAPPPPLPSAPALGAASNTTAAPNAAPADSRQAYVTLVGRASAAMQAGKMTQNEIVELCTKYGIPGLPLLLNRLDLVPQITADFDAIMATRP